MTNDGHIPLQIGFIGSYAFSDGGNAEKNLDKKIYQDPNPNNLIVFPRLYISYNRIDIEK